jgi:hypothetical protein
MLSRVSYGTLSVTTSSEVTLADEPSAGAYELHFDHNARTTADTFLLREYEFAEGSTGTERLAKETTLSGALTNEKINILGPYGYLYGVRAAFVWSVGATTGGRSCPWYLERV